MNQLPAIITTIETDGHVSLITLEALQTSFSALMIDTPATAAYLQIGEQVRMLFKETEMSIGKNLSGGLSLRNRFPARITKVEQGTVLTKVLLDFNGHTLCSLITTPSALALNLKLDDAVEGLVKSNEITLLHSSSF